MANKQICSVDVVNSMTNEDKLLVNIDGKLRQIKVDNIPSKIDPEEFTATKQQIINNDLWNDTKSYVVGDLIIHNNVLYECIINNVGQMPPNTKYWKPRSLSDFNKEINKLNNSLSDVNSKMDSTFKYITTIEPGHDYELTLKSNVVFQAIFISSETRSATVFGKVLANGTLDYWVDKPSSSQIQVSSNTNGLIIGNPSGEGGITVVLSYC